MNLCAGSIADVRWDSGLWIILDIGFSERNKTCGLAIGLAEPVCRTFSAAKQQVADAALKSDQNVNLLIEAPLSVSFDSRDNPTGRSVERNGQRTRYWYVGAGASVMVAAMYLLRQVCELESLKTVKLFEGLISFKSKNVRSDHIRDVRLLREAIQNPNQYPDCIVGPNKLQRNPTDRLVSALSVMGLPELGIPPVIKREVV